MSEQLKNRVKSLAWRTGMMVVAAIVAFGIENAAELHIPSWGVVLLGLVSGEVSKYLNVKK